MILGIGIDIIEIERFAQWHTYSQKKLQRIFSPVEIVYCLADKNKSAQRFAVRFAAREALYKALTPILGERHLPFLTLCSHATVQKIDSRPIITLSRESGIDTSFFTIHLSLSHSRTQAMAFVVIER
jgi:holo-[acyl-carrier protein] synthase